MDRDLFLRRVSFPSELLIGKGDLEFVEGVEVYFGADEVYEILEVPNTGPIVAPLNFIEGSIPPLILIAGIEYAVAAGDGEVSVLDGHLVDEMMVELKDEGLVDPESVDGRTHRDVVDRVVREDGADELYFVFDLLLLYFFLEGGDVCLPLYYEIDDSRLINLLYLFLKYGKSVIKQ